MTSYPGIAVIMALLVSSACAADNYPPVSLTTISTVDGASTYPSSLALTAAGVPVVAFVSGPPDYTVRYLEAGQPAEVVGVAGNQQHAEITLSLALAPDGQPGIAYVDDRFGDLVYAERTAQGWITTTVDAAGQVGYFPSLAFDSTHVPHISYFDNTLNDVKYATRGAVGWRIETIDAEGLPGFHIPSGFTRLVLRCEPNPDTCTTPRPQVAYLAYRYKPYDGELRFATRVDWGWHIETVDSATGAGGFPFLALNVDGRPWISYYRVRTWDYHSGELRVAHRTGEHWQVNVVDRSVNSGRFSALAWSSAGEPVVAYYAARPADLRLAWWDGRWRTQTLAADGDVGAWVQLVIDDNDLGHLTYVDSGVQATKYSILAIPKEQRR